MPGVKKDTSKNKQLTLKIDAAMWKYIHFEIDRLKELGQKVTPSSYVREMLMTENYEHFTEPVMVDPGDYGQTLDRIVKRMTFIRRSILRYEAELRSWGECIDRIEELKKEYRKREMSKEVARKIRAKLGNGLPVQTQETPPKQ